jgi:glycerol-3-phosphate dehydrogenase subunit C
MFRMVDGEWEKRNEITTDQLRHLVNLCNFCAACPCLDIRTAIMEAKTEYAGRYGLGFKIRAIENMDRIGKLGGAIPQVSNFLLHNGVAKTVIKRVFGIHKVRKMPYFANEDFGTWFRSKKRNILPQPKNSKKVAYFSGCTARYFFPDVAKAVVEVLERNGVEVYYPEQKCCGMPPLLEGDRNLTLEFARFNVERLAEVVEKGYDIVCSCPTCGYMMKKILRVGADQAIWRRDSEKMESDFVHIEIGHGLIGAISGMSSVRVPKGHLKVLLKDEGYFSSISPEKRIMISENTYDVGEYLRNLHEAGEFNTRLGITRNRGVYYPPCHVREQKIGRPYQYLMGLIPGLSMESIQGDYCCGNGGVMGFKKDFHHLSIKIASRLIAKIKSLKPEVLATDCLSCKIQFNQLTPYRVVHPVEIIKESYRKYEERVEKMAV